MCKKLLFLFSFVILTLPITSFAQDTTVVLSQDMFDENQVIFLSQLDGWKFKAGNNPDWANPNVSTHDWESLKPADLTFNYANKEGVIEGWFRFRFKLDSTFKDIPLGWRIGAWNALSLYLNGELVKNYGVPNKENYQSYNPNNKIPDFANLEVNKVYDIAVYYLDKNSYLIDRYTMKDVRLDPWIRLAGPEYISHINAVSKETGIFYAIWISSLSLLAFLFWLLVYQNPKEVTLKLIALLTTLMAISAISVALNLAGNRIQAEFLDLIFNLSIACTLGIIPIIINKILNQKISTKQFYLLGLLILAGLINALAAIDIIILFMVVITVFASTWYVFASWKELRGAHWAVVSGLFLTLFWMLLYSILLVQDVLISYYVNWIVTGIYLTLPVSLLIYVSIRFKEILFAVQEKAREVINLSEGKLKAEREKQNLIKNQKQELEKEVKKQTAELRRSLESLKAAQTQLIQQEKLASLGQLTAGIAHEIKNPLNFVNNFSELSVELIEETKAELSAISNQLSAGDKEKVDEALKILDDIEANLKKIHEHGSRADSIVKSMLEHSRGGSGKMEPTDLNSLVKEFVNLSFHGMRASKNPINVDIKFDLDESIGQVPLVAEDFSRVIINLCNNAFDAMREKLSAVSDQSSASYKAKLTVRTKSENGKVVVEIEDNGPGIPDEMKDKILQPFFTTKKGTEGTGLGLSITNDIIKAHGGTIDIKSKQNEFTLFSVTLKQNGK